MPILSCPPPAIVHVPHASTAIPDDVRNQFVLNEADLRTELLRMTDWFTDELFQVADDRAQQIVFPVSRLVVDPERFEDDSQEIMASRGMGVIYNRTSDGNRLRMDLAEYQRANLLDRFYVPHHSRLEQAVDACKAAWGTCLIIDAHSFASAPLPYELNQNPTRPAICIGTDPDHTPDWLADAAEHLARQQGWSVQRNAPFAGALVPSKHHGKDMQSVWSLMIEVRRDLYIDETSGEKSPDFEQVRMQILNLCEQLIASAMDRTSAMQNTDERLLWLDEKYPLIIHTGAGRLSSTVRRMKAERELGIPIASRTGFGVSVKHGRPACELNETEWEAFYAAMCDELKRCYPSLYEQLFRESGRHIDD